MINGTELRDAIISGANNIAKHKTSVDELNIFPVPDGDTGTNMSMTMAPPRGIWKMHRVALAKLRTKRLPPFCVGPEGIPA